MMMTITLKLNFDTLYILPPPGELMLYKGLAYKIISSTYIPGVYDEDDCTPEHLEVEVEDVTSTEEGQVLLADEDIKQSRLRTARYLKLRVKAQGTPIERINGEMVEQPKGTVVLDTFDDYGSGERLIESGESYYYLINNGGDSDDWGINTVKTAGAGAYGWVLSLKQLLGGDKIYVKS